MITFESWYRWMLFGSVFFTFFGGNASLDARAMREFLMGPLGATIAGSYLMQTFIVAVPLKRRER